MTAEDARTALRWIRRRLKYSLLRLIRERKLLIVHYPDGSEEANLMRPTVFPPGWTAITQPREDHWYREGDTVKVVDQPDYKPNRDK